MIDDLIPIKNDPISVKLPTIIGPPPWKLLVVDDDHEVHNATRFVLHDLTIFGRPLRLLHAYTVQQAREHLREHPDIAVALLDVVMETDQAGLELAGYIRDTLGLSECRLILRTGQPGYAPELAVVNEYDINDYRTKAELTHTRLITTISAALRSYEQLRVIAEHRRGLELIVRAAADLLEQHTIADLAEGALTQLAVLFKLPPDSVVFVHRDASLGGADGGLRVVGAAGRHAPHIAQPLETLPDPRIVAAVQTCMSRRQHVFAADHTVLYLKAASHQEAAIFLDSGQAPAALERPLLDVFVANIAACFRNVRLVNSLERARQDIDRQRSFLKAVIDADPHFVYVYVQDRRGRIVLANRSLIAHLDLAPEQLVGQRFSDLGIDPDFLRHQADDNAAIWGGARDRVELEARFADRSGAERWLHTIKVPLKNESGAIEQLIGVGIDITERKRVEQALLDEKERALVTLHSIGDAVITTDATGVVDYLNPAAETLTGWTDAEARGRPLCEVFQIVSEQTRQPVSDPVARCLRHGKVVGLANHTVLIDRRGREYDIDDSAAPIRGQDGRVLGAVLVFRDVTEPRRLSRQLAHDASHDALTGLINRPEFERRLQQALASAQKYGVQHALCYLDLDQFKIVNDTAGHTAGDTLLKQVAPLLSGMFRERDTLARIGGDEFGLLLNHCPLEQAQTIAQTVVGKIRDYRFDWGGRIYQIGVSVGLVPISHETVDIAELLTQADVACYTAKELGRGRVHVYQREDDETTQRHGQILGAAGLRNSLEQGRFRLYYQSIVPLNAPDPRPHRYEALLRVAYKSGPDDNTELVLPAAFIPAAERYGLMNAIDRWVIRTALREYAAGVGQTGVGISINLSANSLSDESLFDYIETQFAEHAFPPERVCFEITGTAAIQNLRRALELLMALKRRGCQLALDDFGSGPSSFHYLKTLPVDYVKIDGSFVKDMIENPSDSALIAAINQMSHSLGIKTIAEHTYNQAIAERLRDMGVDLAQGYFFSHPLPWHNNTA